MKAVVFDMDGVLFDTEQLCMRSWIQVAGEWGLHDMEAVFRQCIGLNGNDTKNLVKSHFGQDFPYDEYHARTSEWFWRDVEENGLPVMAGVREILPYLQESGWKIALASSSRYEAVISHLKRAGIGEFFSVVVTGDMVEHSKPRPDIYILACERLSVEPGEAYAIEDSPNGIRSAHAAGMKPIMVPDQIQPDAEMEEKSFLICKNLFEVMAFLQNS